MEPALLVAGAPLPALLAELRPALAPRRPVPGVRLDRCGVSAFVPGAADDALCPRLVLIGTPDARRDLAVSVGAGRDEVLAPLAVEAIHGLRGPGVAVVCGPSPWARLDAMTSLLRVHGFEVLPVGAPGVREAVAAHLERFRRERSGQLELEVPR